MRNGKAALSFIIICIVVLALSVGVDFALQNGREAEQNSETDVGSISGKDKEPENESVQRPTDSEPEIQEDKVEYIQECEYLGDFTEYYNLPYADEEIFALLREAYGEIVFQVSV